MKLSTSTTPDGSATGMRRFDLLIRAMDAPYLTEIEVQITKKTELEIFGPPGHFSTKTPNASKFKEPQQLWSIE